LGKKFEKMLSLEAKVIMGRGFMAQCEKVSERERARERERERTLVSKGIPNGGLLLWLVSSTTH